MRTLVLRSNIIHEIEERMRLLHQLHCHQNRIHNILMRLIHEQIAVIAEARTITSQNTVEVTEHLLNLQTRLIRINEGILFMNSHMRRTAAYTAVYAEYAAANADYAAVYADVMA